MDTIRQTMDTIRQTMDTIRQAFLKMARTKGIQAKKMYKYI